MNTANTHKAVRIDTHRVHLMDAENEGCAPEGGHDWQCHGGRWDVPKVSPKVPRNRPSVWIGPKLGLAALAAVSLIAAAAVWWPA